MTDEPKIVTSSKPASEWRDPFPPTEDGVDAFAVVAPPISVYHCPACAWAAQCARVHKRAAKLASRAHWAVFAMGPAGAAIVWFVPHVVGWFWIAATFFLGILSGWLDRDAQLAARVMEESFKLAIDAHHGVKRAD